MSLLSNMLAQTSDEIKDKAKALVETSKVVEEATEEFNDKEKAQVLELAYQYSRYLSVRKKQDQKLQAKKAISILSARSKIDESEVFHPYPVPKYRDDEGHHSKRTEISFGQINEQDFTQLGLRMAYHDRLDNLPGYLKGAKLEMFHFKVRHTDNKNANNSTRLQELKLIDIASYSPRNEFLTPISWEVSTGFKRPEAQQDELVAYLTAGWGGSYLWGNQQFYGLGFFDLNIDNDIDKGHHFSAGPKLGWLSQHETWSLNLEVKQPFDLTGAEYQSRSVEIGISKSIARHWQVRVSGEYAKLKQDSNINTASKEFSLSIMHYF